MNLQYMKYCIYYVLSIVESEIVALWNFNMGVSEKI